jgi:hypothetical protein
MAVWRFTAFSRQNEFEQDVKGTWQEYFFFLHSRAYVSHYQLSFPSSDSFLTQMYSKQAVLVIDQSWHTRYANFELLEFETQWWGPAARERYW